MAGGFDAAVAKGAREINGLADCVTPGDLAVDLGAGFGMHAIPLAQRGGEVLAIDCCAALLKELQERAGTLPVEVVEDDLMSFPRHLSRTPRLALCMNDTLAHLTGTDAVIELIRRVYEHLASGGRFVVTFRDYADPLQAENRFIPVRSDPTRIFTCFLEYEDRRVMVSDLIYEWNGCEWTFSVSRYPKLRIDRGWLLAELHNTGFQTHCEAMSSGMIRIVADRE